MLTIPYLKKDKNDYTTFVSVVNREWEKFKFSKLTSNMFKCLIFVQGLTALKDAEIRSHLLSKLEKDLKLTLQNIAEECQWIMNLYCKFEKRDILHLHSIEKKNTVKKKAFLLKFILVIDAIKFTYIKIAHLKIKSIITAVKRDLSSHIVEKNPEKIQNSKIQLTENTFTTIKRNFEKGMIWSPTQIRP